MTIFEYVAINNPHGAKDVLNSFGEKAVRRPDILAKQLANSVNRHGKDALYRIASVHPDLELLSHYNDYSETPEEKEERCGCKKNESIFSSAEGQAIKNAVERISDKQNAVKEPKSEKTELMILGAVALIGLALVLKK